MLNPLDREVKKTLKFGEKLIQEQLKMADSAPMTVQDMRMSMEEDIAKRLQKFVSEQTNLFPGKSFYILVYMGKDMTLETAIRLVMQARWTKPTPEQSSFLYHYDHNQDAVTLIYSLPPAYSMAKIMAMPQDYDPLLVKWVNDYKDGKL